MYALGLGTAKDPSEAVRWHRAAAENGVAASIGALGAAMVKGEGTDKDVEGGLIQLKRASEAGDPGAMRTLAQMSLDGEGMPRSNIEAYYWATLAQRAIAPAVKEEAARREGSKPETARYEELQKFRQALERELTMGWRMSVEQRAARFQAKPIAVTPPPPPEAPVPEVPETRPGGHGVS
jgi:hypothetical protein